MIKTKERFDIEFIDASGYGCFKRCPAKYLFERLMGLKAVDAVKIYLDYGTDMHRAVPYCYGGIEGLDLAVESFRQGWSKRSYGNEDEKRNVDRARLSLQEFAATHSPAICPYEILDPGRLETNQASVTSISKNEVPFDIDIGGNLRARGRLDAGVLWLSDGTKWSLDYKTSGEISARYFNNFATCPQACLYTRALSQIRQVKISGMILEAIRVSKAKVENQMYLIFLSEFEVDECIDQINRASDEILGMNDLGEWPKNFAACGPYPMFGQPGRVCEYKTICSDPRWEASARYFKREKPFDPLVLE